MSIILYLIAGTVILAATAAFYLLTTGIPADHQAWIDFGRYFGSVASPLLSFLALLAVAQNLRFQSRALQQTQDRQMESQHLRALDERFRDINELLDRALDVGTEQQTTVRSILEAGPDSEHVKIPLFAIRLEEHLSLVANYCQMVDLYSENVSPYFDTPMYRDRGARLLDAIKPFKQYLPPMAGATIEFSDMHLKGESCRKTSEAMTRSSRD